MIANISAAPYRERMAAELRGFHTPGWLAFALIALGVAVTPPLGALLILLWAWLSKTPWRELGLIRPRNWVAALALGVAGGVALKLAMKAVAMPLLGAPAVNIGYEYLAHDRAAAIDFAAYAIYGAGFAEELVFRGFLFERFGKLWGAGAIANTATSLVATAIFAVAHWQQGVFGVANAFLTGLVL
ncbi:MAG: CPBP family intramembrane metalloprotease, partial [Alphaproteobacteria bacterium]|nr:CPBP family intramembrane metalloprotease [Alphaproteobacteria bacterium]